MGGRRLAATHRVCPPASQTPPGDAGLGQATLTRPEGRGGAPGSGGGRRAAPDVQEERLALQLLQLLQRVGRRGRARALHQLQQPGQRAHVQAPPVRQLVARHRAHLQQDLYRTAEADRIHTRHRWYITTLNTLL